MGKQKTGKTLEHSARKDTDGKSIRVTCRGAGTLPLDVIEEFQGKLKKRTKKDIQKIIKSILKWGFSFPFFIWEHEGRNLTIDGHGRIIALCELRGQGYSLPLFPVVYIEAENEAEAKEKLLQQNSHYGKITQDGLIEFVGDLEIDLDDLSLPDINIEISSEVKAAEYKEKIELIVECINENHAAELYGEFKDRGIKCRISTL